MGASNGTGIVFLLIFATLVLIVVLLFFRRHDEGILGNKLLFYGTIASSVIVLVIGNGPIINYYKSIFKASPYGFSEFKYFTIQYGNGDSLVNKYNSKTGEYDYLNKRGSLVKKTVFLTRDDLLYLHHRISELGFWDFPATELNTDTTQFTKEKPPHYLIEFNYQQKSKKVLFDASFDGDPALKDSNVQVVNEILNKISEAEDRSKK
jgi:hypothetical protein